MNKFMQIALKEALSGMRKNHGGPFGAVITKNGQVISKAHNEVIKTHDPSAHAEINAIRRASKKLKRFDLSDCEIYSSCEPCPMCLAAIIWSRIKKCYFGCTKEDANKIKFDDQFIYQYLKDQLKEPVLKKSQLNRQECLKAFEKWEKKTDKIPY